MRKRKALARWMVKDSRRWRGDAAQLRRDLHGVALQAARRTWGTHLVKPHAYWPSIIHMGDCQVCGHMQGDEVHQVSERVRSTPADPAG